MRVARVLVRAPVASFRHPFLVTGRQPSFDMPPPSTVHGHCASALGHYPDPAAFFFGIHFTYSGRGVDLEHQHIAEGLGPKSRRVVATPFGAERATTEVGIQPVLREFLFDVAMTLYLAPEVGAAFRAPVYPVVLGRSQDLAEVISVEEVTLVAPTRARIEHTILPRALRPSVRFGKTVLLSRHIGEPPARDASFAQYIVLHEPVFHGEGANPNRALDRIEGVDLSGLFCDPDFVDEGGFSRGVFLHRVADA